MFLLKPIFPDCDDTNLMHAENTFLRVCQDKRQDRMGSNSQNLPQDENDREKMVSSTGG